MKLYKGIAVILMAAMMGGCSAPTPETDSKAEASAAQTETQKETEASPETDAQTQAESTTTAAAESTIAEETTLADKETETDGGEEDPGYTEEDPDDFMGLMDACAKVAPGTSGSSLRQMKAAAQILDWEEELADMLYDEGMRILVASWKEERSQSEWEALKESWDSVAASMEEIAADPQGQADALEDTGYTLGHDSYQTDVMEMVIDAITSALNE